MSAFGCVGSTIRLRSGKYLDLSCPSPDDIQLEDIAGGLAKICRFGGQIDCFYSVAEHSVECARQARVDGVSAEGQMAVLLHDAAEAYIGDVVKPLKEMLPDYKAVESRLEAAIATRFGIDVAKWAPVIREIDHAMLIAERRLLFSRDQVVWHGELEVRQLYPRLACMQYLDAETTFLGVVDHLRWETGGEHSAEFIGDPSPNGIACPRCGRELFDSHPHVVLTSNPPQKSIHCGGCSYRGYRRC